MTLARRQDDVFDAVRPHLVDYYARVAAPRHPSALRLLDYWRSVVAREGDFVIGRDIPARPIASLLCNILVDELAPDGGDLRIRLAGSAIRRRFGADVRGTLLSKLFSPEDFRHHLAAGLEAVRTARPVFLDSSLKRGSVEELHLEVVMLPMMDRDRVTPLLLVGVFYFG